MSIRVKVSYEADNELEYIKEILQGHIAKLKIAKKQSGKYKNAYVEINENIYRSCPCAYLKKVLADLEELSNRYGSESNRRKGIMQAIEIVKKGGVDHG